MNKRSIVSYSVFVSKLVGLLVCSLVQFLFPVIPLLLLDCFHLCLVNLVSVFVFIHQVLFFCGVFCWFAQFCALVFVVCLFLDPIALVSEYSSNADTHKRIQKYCFTKLDCYGELLSSKPCLTITVTTIYISLLSLFS